MSDLPDTPRLIMCLLLVPLVVGGLAACDEDTGGPTGAQQQDITFENNTGEEATDLHIQFDRAVNIKAATPFDSWQGNGTNDHDYTGGRVDPGENASITISWNGTRPEIQSAQWTHQDDQGTVVKQTQITGESVNRGEVDEIENAAGMNQAKWTFRVPDVDREEEFCFNDLHLSWNKAVDVKSASPFDAPAGEKTEFDFSDGEVCEGEQAMVTVDFDGSFPGLQSAIWTQDGQRVGQVGENNINGPIAPPEE